ncbi:acyl-CoA dehydrogenase [Pedobacter sp. HMWF019]|uniref:acyl-CoA dehydrogenase family protein n=1 Tax=Pedobacter sp. HMWF019 TaxID=2056856 RepID=UPI000D333413|nr:acyl-CoA dehydrogenase family protein [Pedobacter sp. HMWF019]PTT01515.1 acyl-CoA dehydrogenase [Pedobacter sp. HMWF019]
MIPEYIHDFELRLKYIFREKYNIDQISLERGLPKNVLEEIMAERPLAAAIPEIYGGRGCQVRECLGILAAASYESLPLSLTFGINIALFLEPVAKYADPSLRPEIFKRFLEQQNMGGLMITEPDFGSDALNMKTTNKTSTDGYHIKGTKHWQGLTGMADYWLIASRNQKDNGDLSRDIDFFLCDRTKAGQQIVVEQYYDNPGLYMIPYGLNQLDIHVPSNYKLQPETTGIKMMLDILHRSRMQFPGMGMGFIKRMLDEALAHCQQRNIGNSKLIALDNIQFQLSRMQAAYTICSAMCVRSSQISGINHNLAAEGMEANAMKTVVTDLMQECAHLLVQLSGANGYRTSHIGGRGIMDSRPFQIFEGSNEMLYAQIAETTGKMMKKHKLRNLIEFLEDFPLTQRAGEHFRKTLSFEIEENLPQRKLVDLGKIIARIICISYVLEMQDKGFREDLIKNAITTVQQEVSALVTLQGFNNSNQVIEDYQSNSSWLEMTKSF